MVEVGLRIDGDWRRVVRSRERWREVGMQGKSSKSCGGGRWWLVVVGGGW